MYDLLMQTLEDADFDFGKDRCFSCGDLIDRGPESAKCISLVQQPWFFPVRGNHEDILIEVAQGVASDRMLNNWISNGGEWHLGVSKEQLQAFSDLLERLPFVLEIELVNGKRVGVCHGEFPLNSWMPDKVAADDDLIEALLWSREKVLNHDDSVVTGIDDIYCGHTIVGKPVTLGNTHFIDTGAFHTNNLTMALLT